MSFLKWLYYFNSKEHLAVLSDKISAFFKSLAPFCFVACVALTLCVFAYGMLNGDIKFAGYVAFFGFVSAPLLFFIFWLCAYYSRFFANMLSLALMLFAIITAPFMAVCKFVVR